MVLYFFHQVWHSVLFVRTRISQKGEECLRIKQQTGISLSIKHRDCGSVEGEDSNFMASIVEGTWRGRGLVGSYGGLFGVTGEGG
jgi:hypothetical protein